MTGRGDIREGMPVYGADDRLIGTVAAARGDAIEVGGRRIPTSAVARIEGGRVYLSEAGARYQATGAPAGERREGEIAVPVAEERLRVDKREAELGAVEVRKTVEQEQVAVPVELEREEVRVDQRDVDDRPVQAGARVFQGDTIRVPVRGEEALVSKEAVVTGEVVVEKERTTEREQITDTVRRERVEVQDTTQREQAGAEDTAQRAGAGMADIGTAETRTSGTATGGMATDVSRQVRAGMEVVGSDGRRVGLVKEARAGDLLVDRTMQRDVYVPLNAIREVTGERVVLTVLAHEVDDQGWPNPPLI